MLFNQHYTHWQTLRTVCFGSATTVPEPEWVRSGVVFHPPGDLHAFGLKPQRGAVKPFLMALQVSVLKYLMFHTFSKKGAPYQ